MAPAELFTLGVSAAAVSVLLYVLMMAEGGYDAAESSGKRTLTILVVVAMGLGAVGVWYLGVMNLEALVWLRGTIGP